MSTELFLFIADVLLVDVSELTFDSTSETVGGWDSEREIELAIMLEVEYGVTLNGAQMSRLRSVRAIVDVLAEHGIAYP